VVNWPFSSRSAVEEGDEDPCRAEEDVVGMADEDKMGERMLTLLALE